VSSDKIKLISATTAANCPVLHHPFLLLYCKVANGFGDLLRFYDSSKCLFDCVRLNPKQIEELTRSCLTLKAGCQVLPQFRLAAFSKLQ